MGPPKQKAGSKPSSTPHWTAPKVAISVIIFVLQAGDIIIFFFNLFLAHKSGAIEHYTTVEVQGDVNCTKAAGVFIYNPEIHVCALASTDACEFDFGSALACQKRPNSNEFVLKGVYSHNTGCLNRKPTLLFNKNEIEWMKAVIKTEKSYWK